MMLESGDPATCDCRLMVRLAPARVLADRTRAVPAASGDFGPVPSAASITFAIPSRSGSASAPLIAGFPCSETVNADSVHAAKLGESEGHPV
jgi:hypothetical protein